MSGKENDLRSQQLSIIARLLERLSKILDIPKYSHRLKEGIAKFTLIHKAATSHRSLEALS